MTPSSVSFSTSHFWRSPLGSDDADHELERQLAVDFAPFDDSQLRRRRGRSFRRSRASNSAPLPSKSVTRSPDRGPHHVQQVMRLRAVERDALGGDRLRGKEAVGHGEKLVSYQLVSCQPDSC